MIVEAGFVGLVGAVAHKVWKRKNAKLTPEDETIYLEALANLNGPSAPERFRKLAKWMTDHGHRVQAKVLRTRADYLEEDQKPEVKAQRREIIAKAMKSVNVAAILKVAAWFEAQTATGIARDLRKHAKEVESGEYPPKPETKENGEGNTSQKMNGHANGHAVNGKEGKSDAVQG